MRRRSSRSNRQGTPRMRLPMSVPAPGIFSTASENFFGMKWVYASMRMESTPDLNLRPRRGQDVAMKAGEDFAPEGARGAGGCQGILTSLLSRRPDGLEPLAHQQRRDPTVG